MFLWQGDKMTIGIIKTPAEEIALFRMVDIRPVQLRSYVKLLPRHFKAVLMTYGSPKPY